MANRKNHKALLKKGERRIGRAKGTPNKMGRDVKEALLKAAELSVHSKTHDLVGYAKFLADKKPEVFASLLGRLIPVQANVKHTGGVGATHVTVNMPLGEMINNFERMIRSPPLQVAGPVIEHDEAEAS